MLTFLQKQFFLLRCHFNFKLQLFWPKHGFIFYIFGRFAGLLFLVCCVIVSYIFFQLYFCLLFLGLLHFWSIIFLVCYIFSLLYFLYFWSVVLLSIIFLSVILYFDYFWPDISLGYYIFVCNSFGLLQFCFVIFLPPFDQHDQPMNPPTEGGQVT